MALDLEFARGNALGMNQPTSELIAADRVGADMDGLVRIVNERMTP
jgi:hypothetical protein